MTDEDITRGLAPIADSGASKQAAVAAEFSPALAALKRPPKVGDIIEHDGRELKIIGATIRGAGDFSVEVDGGRTLHSTR